jgi:hypothetical protein
MSLISHDNKLKLASQIKLSSAVCKAPGQFDAIFGKTVIKNSLLARQRKPVTAPIILAGYGVSLKIDAGTVLVRNGFTHFPQPQETYRFFKQDPELRSRIVMLDGSGTLSFDALTWLAEQLSLGMSPQRSCWCLEPPPSSNKFDAAEPGLSVEPAWDG